MPELPEVETVCRGLAGVLEGRRLTRVVLRRKDLRIPFPKDLVARLTGRRVEKIFRRAKYAVMALDSGDAVIAHLGMAGRMLIVTDGRPLERHDHVVFVIEDGIEVRFNDPRRFGLLTVASLAELGTHKLFRHLGPDPLEDAFTPAMLSAALKGKSASIKTALLDQRLVVGVGNIYACESLYLAGISPKRKAGTVAGARAELLVPAIKRVLRNAIAAGGSSLRDHIQPSGELGYFQHAWKVYGREGEPCACASGAADKPGPKTPLKTPPKTQVVKRIVQGGRSTFYCAQCQK